VLERNGGCGKDPVVATPGGRGWWRLESSLTAPTERDRYRLKMEMDGQGLEGCSTEFTAAPS
jgi:hypothetical protein